MLALHKHDMLSLESLESLESVFVWQNVKERGGEDVVAKIDFIIVKKQY